MHHRQGSGSPAASLRWWPEPRCTPQIHSLGAGSDDTAADGRGGRHHRCHTTRSVHKRPDLQRGTPILRRVIEVGGAVSEYRVGDQVACVPSAWCVTCDACHRGHPLLCRRCRPLSCGFAEYIAVPATSAVKLPATLSLADGALVEPMACGLHALRMAGINRGD